MVLATLLALLAPPAMAQDVIGMVKRSAGQVLIDHGGVQTPPVVGTEVHRGDRVITGPDGYASIAMHGAAPVRVGPGADICLDRFVREQRPIAERFIQPIIQGVASLLGGMPRR